MCKYFENQGYTKYQVINISYASKNIIDMLYTQVINISYARIIIIDML